MIIRFDMLVGTNERNGGVSMDSSAMHRLLCAARASFLGMLVVASASVADPFAEVRAHVWKSADRVEDFPPEMHDERVSVPWLADRPSFGIAFSGGGTRSATATLGQLRALDRLGWLGRARYIAANSGGTWTAVPFTYLPGSIEQSRFLGPTLGPDAINDRTLHPTDDEEEALAMATVLHHAKLGNRLKPALLQGDEAYADLVGEIFLEPFGLHDKKRFFTFHDKARQAILDANTDLEPASFYTVEQADRPFLILVGTLLGKRKKAQQDQRYLFEITPLYVGVRGRFAGEKRGRPFAVGGGYIEPFGYDSRPPGALSGDNPMEVSLRGRLRDGDKPWSDRYRFTLSDAIGISSAAPEVLLSSRGLPTKAFPEFRHWAIDHDPAVTRRTVELPHGDGGDIDNLAVFPLLGRKVENLLVFINTRARFEPNEGSCNDLSDQNMTDDLVSFFTPLEQLPNNVVFEGGQAELAKICRTFQAQRAQKAPLIHCQRYRVVANPRQGIAPYEPSVCWAYLERAEQWIDALDPAGGALTRALRDRARPFDNFPHYKTFLEKGGSLIDLDRERVHALANFTAWSLLEAASQIREGLTAAALP